MADTTNTEAPVVDWSDPASVATALTEAELALDTEEESVEDEEEVETKEANDVSDEDTSDDADADEEEADNIEEEDLEDNDSETEDDDLFEQEETKAELSDDTLLTVNDQEMTIHELKEGFKRQADYTKDKQELATYKEQVKGLEQEAMVYMTKGIDKYQAMLNEASKIDMVKLADTDPRKYSRVRASIDQINDKIAEESKVVQEWHETYQKELSEQTEREVKAAMPIIEEAIPGFNEKKGGEVLAYASKIGMAEDKAKAITDPHFIIALEKAMRYDKAKSAASLRRQPKKQGKTIKAKSTADVAHVESKKTRALREEMSNTSNPERIAAILTELQFQGKK
ncbi:MAG: hypothetical protein DRP93_00220 [Candidatus Neomarinimicrobiota bacterium]|nr:MAG: hypothetical protein DRP93_00220 [Candidatus Neomarinimicrobiota bacterium]